VSPNRSGSDAPGSILRDNTITLDLRHPPTRADLGFADGRNNRAYQRAAGDPEIATTVLLPTGTLRTPAFLVSADGNDYTPAGTHNPRQPELISVQRVFGSAAQAADSLTADAALLGLDRADLELLITRVEAGRPPKALPQQGTLTGFVRDWLSAQVDVIGHDDPSVQVNYTFAINVFHSPAIDKVVHDGVFGLDLTRQPSRADLALRDTYSLAILKQPPGGMLTARLTLPGGVLSRAVQEVESSSTDAGFEDPTGTGRPRQTQLFLEPSGAGDAERTLHADAALLGLDPRAIDAVFGGPPDQHVVRTLTGGSTNVYRITVRVDVTPGQPGRFAAALRYDITYR
jgi:hypothetical protein